MKLCNHSRQSFDKVIPDLFSVNFIPSYGLWKFCLNCINLTSVPWPMDFSDITSSIIFIFSWSRLPMGWERQITFCFKHCPQALIAWQNFLHRKSCSIQKCLDTWDVFCVVFSIQIFRSKVKYFLAKYVKSLFTYLITYILIPAQSIELQIRLHHLVQILPKKISNFNFFMSMSHPMEIHQQSWPIHSISCSQYVIMIFIVSQLCIWISLKNNMKKVWANICSPHS